jgi:hypothetical protein
MNEYTRMPAETLSSGQRIEPDARTAAIKTPPSKQLVRGVMVACALALLVSAYWATEPLRASTQEVAQLPTSPIVDIEPSCNTVWMPMIPNQQAAGSATDTVTPDGPVPREEAAEVPAAVPVIHAPLVADIDISLHANDPSDVAYNAYTRELFVVDGEIEEQRGGAAARNVLVLTASGTFLWKTSIVAFNPEPVGIAFTGRDRLIITNDDRDNADLVTRTNQQLARTGGVEFAPLDGVDPEGISQYGDKWLIADGADGLLIYHPHDGKMDSLCPIGNDTAQIIDTAPFGYGDVEGVRYDKLRNTVLIVSASNRASIGEIRIDEQRRKATLVHEIVTENPGYTRPSGIEIVADKLVITYRGVDNSQPNNTDGRIVIYRRPALFAANGQSRPPTSSLARP